MMNVCSGFLPVAVKITDGKQLRGKRDTQPQRLRIWETRMGWAFAPIGTPR